MLTLLAIIGLIWILYKVSKGLRRFGTWLENLGECLASRSVRDLRTRHNCGEARTRVTKVRETLSTMQCEEPDDGYMDRVRNEINRLM